MSALARRVGMSPPAVTERVQRLTDDGVIGLRLEVHAASTGALEETLDRFLLFGQTVSSLVVSTSLQPRPLVPEAVVAD